MEEVRSLLDAGADITKTDHFNKTPLEEAVESGSVEVARLLIDEGVDPNRENEKGHRPIHRAFGEPTEKSRSAEIVELLLEHGANADPPLSDGFYGPRYTPLCAAAKSGYSEAMGLLLEGGADPHAEKNSDALFLAAGSGSRETVELLLQEGIDPLQANDREQTPLFDAAGSGSAETVELLLEEGLIPPAPTRMRPLHSSTQPVLALQKRSSSCLRREPILLKPISVEILHSSTQRALAP